MKLRKYTEQQLRTAVKQCTSLRQVLIQLGVAEYGGNHEVLTRSDNQIDKLPAILIAMH